MALISLEGAVDLHVHTYPCLIPRLCDDQGAAAAAAEAGMAAIVLKCHHESTVSRAAWASRAVPEIKVFGGIVLNSYVGGFNPAAAEAALRLGAKEVWMPTIDAANHARVYGSRGKYDVQTSGKEETEGGLTVFRGEDLAPEVKEILALIAQYDAILGTCHLSPEEIFALVKAARDVGVRRILITHPFFRVPGLQVGQIKALTEMGAMAEFGYCTVSPMWAYVRVEQVLEALREVGPQRAVLMSDAGQRHNPMPPESLRVFAQCLHEKGLPEADIRRLIVENPRSLLGLD